MSSFAALVAPAIDRAFVAGMRLAREGGGREVTARHGPGAGGWLIEFRTALAWPDRRVTPGDLAAVIRYRDPDEARQSIRLQAAMGWLTVDADGGFRATDKGRAFLADIWATQAAALGPVWPVEPVDRLTPLVGRLLTAAQETGGAALAAMTPVYEPAGTPDTVLLLNRLGTLRYHRADAHAAAWTAAGLTAAQIQALEPGPARDAIEAGTNERAAAPYTILSEDERRGLLADLAAFPS